MSTAPSNSARFCARSPTSRTRPGTGRTPSTWHVTRCATGTWSARSHAIATRHHNLGNYLARHAADHRQALAHHLASALLCVLTGIEGADSSLGAAAGDLARLPDGAPAPVSVSALCGIAGEVPGVHLDRLLTQLADPAATQDALDVLLTQARAQADPNVRFAGSSRGVGPGDRRHHRRRPRR